LSVADDAAPDGSDRREEQRMKRLLLPLLGVAAMAALAFPAMASAQSGHFVGTPTCTDIGTQLQCTGKVAGLGGTTFTINVQADNATASVTCTNPAGNVAPGQSFDFDASGSTGAIPTTTNGRYNFTVKTAAPSAPAGSCPNPKWTASVADVTFSGTATLTLLEDSTQSDQVTVQL
jgi:hypothetical protein